MHFELRCNIELHIRTDFECSRVEVNFEQFKMVLNATHQIFKVLLFLPIHHICQNLIENIFGVNLHFVNHNVEVLVYFVDQCLHQLNYAQISTKPALTQCFTYWNQ